MDYDEEAVLDQYIWNHYQHLMTDFERKVGRAILTRVKADALSEPELANFLRQRVGDDRDVNAALQNGFDAYRREVRQRVLRENGDQVFLNRCPMCSRIVRTPEARLCLWCGHSWFEKST